MKKIIMSFMLAAVMIFMAGCGTSIDKYATIAGKTVGYACEFTAVKPDIKENVNKILTVVSEVVPATNETFAVAWKPYVEKEVQKLKIGDSEKTIVQDLILTACRGIDYVFEKYPATREKHEVVSVVVHNFIDGYKSVGALSSNEKPEIDEDLYKIIKSKSNN